MGLWENTRCAALIIYVYMRLFLPSSTPRHKCAVFTFYFLVSFAPTFQSHSQLELSGHKQRHDAESLDMRKEASAWVDWAHDEQVPAAWRIPTFCCFLLLVLYKCYLNRLLDMCGALRELIND